MQPLEEKKSLLGIGKKLHHRRKLFAEERWHLDHAENVSQAR